MNLDETYLKTITEDQMELYFISVLNNPYIKYKPYIKQSIPLIYCLEPEHNNEVHSILLGGSGYGGKGLSLDTIIPTVDGFKIMEDIIVGDLLFNEYGEPTKVLYVSPVHYLKCYEVTFSDGTVVTCDEDHLWLTNTYNSRLKRNNDEATVKSMDEIIKSLHHNKTRNNHSINNCKPLNYNHKLVNIPPYTLGAWLGDGTSSGGGFTTNDYEIIDEIMKDGFEISKHKYKYGYGILGLHKLLRENDLLNNKHIPFDYIFNDKDTRLSIIQGLMDTDGNINKDGSCEFVNKNYDIVYGLKLLLNSFGINCTIRTKMSKYYDKECGLVYRLKFRTSLPIFRLKRKLERIKPITRAYKKHIISIEEVPTVPTKCIMVDNPTSLYLCTEACIPTHNTFVGTMLALQYINDDASYTCLVTRRNYAELLDTNSIWDNVIDWACSEDLPSDIRCDFVKSPAPKVIHPNGNTIYFKAFDNIKKKGKFKSTSYDRIINDEASELPDGILPFQYRSMRNTSSIPRSIINLSNPGGESTQYLVDKFVDGDKPYISLGWQDNVHINREAYHNSLKELDYIDYQYQALGDWHYSVSIGDLITDEEVDNSLCSFKDYDKELFYLLSVDLASTGTDLTVISLLCFNKKDNTIIIIDSLSSEEPIADKLIINACDKYNNICYDIVIEQEGGSTPTYFKNYINEKIFNYGLDYNIHLERPNKSKYQRARPLCSSLKNGKCLINKDYTNYDKLKYELSNLNPLGVGASPNFVDSVSLGYNWLDNKRLKQSRVRVVKL